MAHWGLSRPKQTKKKHTLSDDPFNLYHSLGCDRAASYGLRRVCWSFIGIITVNCVLKNGINP